MGDETEYPQALPVGTVLGGRYIIERVLGQGGFGITYAAKVHKTDELVAVKEYFPDMLVTRTNATLVTTYPGPRRDNFRDGMKMFLDEAKTLSQFNHDNGIVHIYTYFEENGTAYFAMELLQGTDLQNYMNARGGRIEWAELKRLIMPVMDALANVHSRGIIHRDIKPENIFISDDGSVKLIDFGSARYSVGEKSRSIEVMLTPGFAPTEQYSRNQKQAAYTDVYAIAATIYYAATGKIPPDSVDRVPRDELVPPRVLGAAMSKEEELTLLKALEVESSNRFQTVAEFSRHLAGNIAPGGVINTAQSSTTAVRHITQQQVMTAGQQVMTTGQQVMTTGQQVMTNGQRMMTTGQQVMTAGQQVMITGQQNVIQSYTGNLDVLPPPPPPDKSREKIIIAVAAVSAVLIIAVIALIFVIAGSSGDAQGTPATTVPAYTAANTQKPAPPAETSGKNAQVITRTYPTETGIV